MNFLKGSLFRRNTEPEELEPMEESRGGILAVWGQPRLRQDGNGSQNRKALGSPEEKYGAAALRYDRTYDALYLSSLGIGGR